MSDPAPRFKRVLLKLSGEALMGPDAYGINRQTITEIVGEVKSIVDLGVQVGVVIGGGNIFRGVAPAATGMDRAQADYMGMLATVMNALALQDAMRVAGMVARVQSALTIEQVVEPYIRGKELAVAVMDGKALTVTDILPVSGFYDYEAKYAEGGSKHVLPAEIPAHAYEKALEMAERAHAALGCRGVTRSDLRYDDINDILVLLEVNTQPGMTPTSLVPEQAALKGVEFDRLVLWITEDAYARGSAGGVASVSEAPGENAR